MIWLDVPVLGSWTIVYVSLRPTGQQRFLQVLVGVGPVFSFFAACDVEALGQRDTSWQWWMMTHHDCLLQISCRYIWSFHREETNLAELLAPLVCLSCICSIHLSTQFALGCALQAYISNGIAVGIMTVFVRVEEQEKLTQNGANTLVLFNIIILMFIDSFDQTSSSQMWWSGERCHASASFQECALPGRVWMGLSKRTAVNRWMNVLSCVIDLRGKKIYCNQCWWFLADSAGNEEAWVFAYACVMLFQWWSWIEDNAIIYPDIISPWPWIFRNTRHPSNVNTAHQDRRCLWCIYFESWDTGIWYMSSDKWFFNRHVTVQKSTHTQNLELYFSFSHLGTAFQWKCSDLLCLDWTRYFLQPTGKIGEGRAFAESATQVLHLSPFMGPERKMAKPAASAVQYAACLVGMGWAHAASALNARALWHKDKYGNSLPAKAADALPGLNEASAISKNNLLVGFPRPFTCRKSVCIAFELNHTLITVSWVLFLQRKSWFTSALAQTCQTISVFGCVSVLPKFSFVLTAAGHALLRGSSTCMGECQCSGAELQGPTREVSSFLRFLRLTRLAIWILDMFWYVLISLDDFDFSCLHSL